MTYMTRQQQAVLDCIAACPGGCATAMALADRLRSGGQSVGPEFPYYLPNRKDLCLLAVEIPAMEEA